MLKFYSRRFLRIKFHRLQEIPIMKKLVIVCIFLLPIVLFGQDMTIKKMEKILKKEAKIVEGSDGIWTVQCTDLPVMIVTDAKANRMRIFSPIVERAELNERALEKMLEANFHSALDAKYSIWEGVVISVFTHPLQQLSEEQFVDALHQVVRLVDTFGTTFSSTEFIFGEEEKIEEDADKRGRINVKPGDKKS